MSRPQNSPYPESWPGGVSGQAAARSCGDAASSRMATGVCVTVTSSKPGAVGEYGGEARGQPDQEGQPEQEDDQRDQQPVRDAA